MGTRVRLESRVVSLTGLWAGTPAGRQGSPGPRGEPGKTAHAGFFFSAAHALKMFYLYPGIHLLLPSPQPPTTLGASVNTNGGRGLGGGA